LHGLRTPSAHVAATSTASTPRVPGTSVPVTPWVMVMDADAVPSSDAATFRNVLWRAQASAPKRGGDKAGGPSAWNAFVVMPFEGVAPEGPAAIKAAKPGTTPTEAGAALLASQWEAFVRMATTPPPPGSAGDAARLRASKAWLAAQHAAGAARVFFSNFLPSAYKGNANMQQWLTTDKAQGGVPHKPNFEPYAIFKAPVPLFDTFYRGRGFSKSGWYALHGATGAFKYTVLPEVYFFVRTDLDEYRHGGGLGMGGNARPANRRENVMYFRELWDCFRKKKSEVNAHDCTQRVAAAWQKKLPAT
jgi:hypothetical protein